MARAKTEKYTLFGKEIAKALIDKDWDNGDLAEALGLKSGAYITDILQGNRKATKKKKEMLTVLNMPNSTGYLDGGIYGVL